MNTINRKSNKQPRGQNAPLLTAVACKLQDLLKCWIKQRQRVDPDQLLLLKYTLMRFPSPEWYCGLKNWTLEPPERWVSKIPVLEDVKPEHILAQQGCQRNIQPSDLLDFLQLLT